MNTKDIEWRIARYHEILGYKRLLDYEERIALRGLPRNLDNDFEELGASIIYQDDLEQRRKYVNLMAEIFKIRRTK